jgi:hypothetical protein
MVKHLRSDNLHLWIMTRHKLKNKGGFGFWEGILEELNP